MSQELRVHGMPKPKGSGWLKGVKVDAARAAIQHLKEQKEREEFKLAKARGITPEEILNKGRNDLGVVKGQFKTEDEADFEDDFEVEDESFDDEPAKPLAQMNKSELHALCDEEGVPYEPEMTNKELVEAVKAHREENN